MGIEFQVVLRCDSCGKETQERMTARTQIGGKGYTMIPPREHDGWRFPGRGEAYEAPAFCPDCVAGAPARFILPEAR